MTDALLAATDDGLFAKSTGETSWQRAGLPGFDILDVAVFSDEHFLASTYVVDDEGYPRFVRYRTGNRGHDWDVSTDDFGEGGVSDRIAAFYFDPTTDRLYATGTSALASSDDFGQTWELKNGFFGGLGMSMPIIRLNHATNELWYGGQGPIENGFLIQYDLTTGSPTRYSGLLPNPSVFTGIRFDASRPDVVYASGEGGIAFTADRGQSWTNLLGDVDYRFYFDVALDPEDPSYLYTAGWTKTHDPQPLVLEWSTDRGESWHRHRYPAADDFFGGVRSMIMGEQEGEKVWYLGLFRGGIMKVTVHR